MMDEIARIIDVRERFEYVAGHPQGAESVPLGNLIDSARGWDRKKPLLLVCASGARSRQGAELLAASGFQRVYNFVGGVAKWRGQLVKGG